MTIRFNGRLYEKINGRWFVDSRKRLRPVYDPSRLEQLEKFESGQRDCHVDTLPLEPIGTHPIAGTKQQEA